MSQIQTKFIADKAVTNAKLADMASGLFKGRTTTGSGAPEDLTSAQATALLASLVGDTGAGGTKGLVPAPAAGDAAAGKFLDAAGNWAVPTMPSVPTATSEQIVLSGTDITNQYVDLAHAATGASASINSINLSVVGGPMQDKTVDYSVALTGGTAGVTRITFLNGLATAGASALVASDILIVNYSF